MRGFVAVVRLGLTALLPLNILLMPCRRINLKRIRVSLSSGIKPTRTWIAETIQPNTHTALKQQPDLVVNMPQNLGRNICWIKRGFPPSWLHVYILRFVLNVLWREMHGELFLTSDTWWLSIHSSQIKALPSWQPWHRPRIWRVWELREQQEFKRKVVYLIPASAGDPGVWGERRLVCSWSEATVQGLACGHSSLKHRWAEPSSGREEYSVGH